MVIASQISILDLRFDCIIGILELERIHAQPISLSIYIDLDFSLIDKEESIQNSIDYSVLAEEVEDFIKNAKFKLIESLVYKTAKHILSLYPQAQKVKVEVLKPKAIPNAKAASASVILNQK